MGSRIVLRTRLATRRLLGPTLIFAFSMAISATACTSVDERRRSVIARAEQLLALGEVERAVTVLEAFRDFDPRDVETTLRLAEIRLDQRRACDALGLLDALAPDAGSSVPSHRADDRRTVALARALAGCGSWQRAAPVLVALHRRGTVPEDALETWLSTQAAAGGFAAPVELPVAWRVRLTEKLIRHRQLEPAIESRRMLPPGHPEGRVLLEKILQAAVNGARIEVLRTLEEKDAPPETPWKLLARHRLLTEAGLEDEAALLERRFSERFPDHPRRFDMLLSLARREMRSGRPEEGLELARRASALRPTRIEPLLEQALALDSLGRRREARRALAAVLGMQPGHAAALQLSAEWRRQEETGGLGEGTGGLRKMELTFAPGAPQG